MAAGAKRTPAGGWMLRVAEGGYHDYPPMPAERRPRHIAERAEIGEQQRPGGFPQSVVLCGVRDVRDHRIRWW